MKKVSVIVKERNLLELGNCFYEENKNLFCEGDYIKLENYDKIMDDFHEKILVEENQLINVYGSKKN